MQKGKIRNPWMVLFLTIVTFGLYLLYWLVINPIELKNAFQFEKNENQLKLTFIFMIIGACITVVYVMYTVITSVSMNFENLFLYSSIYTFIMVIISGFFFYYLCSSTILVQKKAKVEPFELITVFGIYMVNILIEGGSDLLILSSKIFKNFPEKIDKSKSFDLNSIQDLVPLFNMVGIINLLSSLLFLLFLFLLQKQLNRIWEEGEFPDA